MSEMDDELIDPEAPLDPNDPIDPDSLTSPSGRSLPLSNVVAFNQVTANTWGIQGGGYNPERFYTSSTDNSSKASVYLKVSVPASIAAQMASLIQGNRFDAYQTIQDIMRDALHHRLHFLSELADDPNMHAVLAMNRRVSEMQRHQTEVEALAGYIDQVKGALDFSKKHGDVEGVAGIVQELQDTVGSLRQPWKAKVDELLIEGMRWLEDRSQ